MKTYTIPTVEKIGVADQHRGVPVPVPVGARARASQFSAEDGRVILHSLLKNIYRALGLAQK